MHSEETPFISRQDVTRASLGHLLMRDSGGIGDAEKEAFGEAPQDLFNREKTSQLPKMQVSKRPQGLEMRHASALDILGTAAQGTVRKAPILLTLICPNPHRHSWAFSTLCARPCTRLLSSSILASGP